MGLSILHLGSGLRGWTGVSRHLLNVCRGLQERGHQVRLACVPNWRLDLEARKRGIETHALYTREEYDWRRFPAFFREFRSRHYDVGEAARERAWREFTPDVFRRRVLSILQGDPPVTA